MALISDPFFFLLAIPAVLITGTAKGGFGAGLGVLAVPLMTITVPPLQAAAIMLPILCVMDVFGLIAYRGRWDRPLMAVLIPGALIGIGIGTLTAGMLSNETVRILIGIVAVTFSAHYWLGPKAGAAPRTAHWLPGTFWSAISGFTSFVAHAGGPPFWVYTLPLKMDKTRLTATAVVFFAIVNYIKLVPYAYLGQFTFENLVTALVLAPLAPAGIYAGYWLHQRISADTFYRMSYALVFVTGAKLIWDSVDFRHLLGWLGL